MQIIASGSAMHPLIEAGVEPDMVVVSDPKPINAIHFPPKQYNYPLAYDVVIPANILKHFCGDKLVINLGHGIVELLAQVLSFTSIKCWGTVSSTALALCEAAGFDEVVLIGMDFSFIGNKTHVDNYLLPGNDVDFIEVKDFTGKKINTFPNFIGYAGYMNDQVNKLADNGMKIYNCCDGGILTAGEKISLREYYSGLVHDNVKKEELNLAITQ